MHTSNVTLASGMLTLQVFEGRIVSILPSLVSELGIDHLVEVPEGSEDNGGGWR